MIPFKKKILLITPENEEINKFRKRQFNNFIQITMPYLAAFIDESKFQITIIDEYNQKIPYDSVFDLVAITVNTPNAVHCYNIAERFRSYGSKVAMGGPHVTLLPDEARLHCDYIFVGEAELTWPQFLFDFYKGCTKAEYVCSETPSLDNLPVPRRDLIHKRKLTKGAVFASRGCPYNCSYCNLKQIYSDTMRTRPVDEVIDDIRDIKSRYFVFWDDNFFGDVEYAKILMDKLKSINKRWAAQVTLERCQDEDLLRLAKESGCIYLFVGWESFYEESLLSVNKGINNVKRYKEIISLMHRCGISIQAGIIFGFDTDKRDVFEKTLKACNELGIDGATVSILTPLPNTPVYNKLEEEGRLITDDWTYYNGKTRVAFQPQNMTPGELFEGYMWFRKSFYSMRSMIKRLSVSKVNTFHNLFVNLGYRLSTKNSKQNK